MKDSLSAVIHPVSVHPTGLARHLWESAVRLYTSREFPSAGSTLHLQMKCIHCAAEQCKMIRAEPRPSLTLIITVCLHCKKMCDCNMYQHIHTAFNLASEDIMTWSLRLSFTSLLETLHSYTVLMYVHMCAYMHVCVCVSIYMYVKVYICKYLHKVDQ